MARLDVNRSGEMEVFARVFELGGFSAAARELRMTPSAISKLVGRLETRLGARLVNRSTKGLQFTPEGRLFYDRSIRLLADLDEVERSVAKSKVPSGKIRVSANLPVGRSLLLPIVPAFLDTYPKLSLEISLTDQVIDLIEANRRCTAQRPAQKLPAYCAEARRCADGDRRITGLFCATRRSEDA